MPKKHTYKYIKQYFETNNCKLLDTEYINTDTKMNYMCKCGNKSKISFYKFKIGQRCKKCSGREKLNIEYIYNFFKNNECELLDKEYINSSIAMNYICKCGSYSKINWDNFKKGVRCKNCAVNRNSGETHYLWKENREEIKLNLRLRKSFSRKWIKNNMQHNPKYNDFLNNSKEYNLDHIIPVSIFTKIVLEYKLDEKLIKEIINKKENLQILTYEKNMSKFNKGCIFKACQYLSLNGIKLIKVKE